MALPSISTPEFQTKVPSTGETITYRPFLVKEEKILLMAMEGGDENEITRSVLKILENCIISNIDMNSLATFDIEYLFLQLRGKSVGEVITLQVMHPNNDECKHATEVQVNLDDINVKGDISDGKIMLTDDVGVKMKYPSINHVTGMDISESKDMFTMVASCIDFIYDSENVYNEFTKEEIIEWIEGLNQAQFKNISEFFESMPRLSTKVEWTCSKCNKKDDILLEGLQSFFT